MLEGMPPQAPPDIPHTCIISAASAYRLPPLALVLIRQQEAGQPGTVSANTNGTHDHGVMQINTIHIERLSSKLGVAPESLTNDACVSVFGAATLLSEHLERNSGDIWKSMGDYHSRTPKFHNRYLDGLRKRYARLLSRYGEYAQWLASQSTRAMQMLGDTLPGPLVTFHGLPRDANIEDTRVNTAFSAIAPVNPYVRSTAKSDARDGPSNMLRFSRPGMVPESLPQLSDGPGVPPGEFP